MGSPMSKRTAPTSNSPEARSRGWRAELNPEDEQPFSQADAIALVTPLVSLTTVLHMPEAEPASRARVAPGLLYSMQIAAWSRANEGDESTDDNGVRIVSFARSEGDDLTLPSGETVGVGPEELGADAVHLVALSQDRREVRLSGKTWDPRKLSENEASRLIEGCQRLGFVVASWQSFTALAQWFRRDVRDLLNRGEAVELPRGVDSREWWVLDEGDGFVRAKHNAFELLRKLAKAWAKVDQAERDAAETARKRLASPFTKTAPMLSPVARALHATMTGPVQTETVGMLEQLIIEAPPGSTRSLASLALDWGGSWGGTLREHFTPKPMVAKVYACSLAESADERAGDLSWVQNHEHMAEAYFGTVSKRKVEEISEAFRELRKIVVLKAGKYIAKDGIGQRLIEAIDTEDGKNPRYRHCMLMAAALGLYEDEERDRLGMAKQLVQVPRALIPVDHRLFPLGLGGAIMVRDNLESLRKRGKVVLPQEAFFRGVGRLGEAKKRGVAEELRTAAKVFGQGNIGTAPVLRGDVVEFTASKVLADAYAQTMANAARFEAASAKAATKKQRSAKK